MSKSERTGGYTLIKSKHNSYFKKLVILIIYYLITC